MRDQRVRPALQLSVSRESRTLHIGLLLLRGSDAEQAKGTARAVPLLRVRLLRSRREQAAAGTHHASHGEARVEAGGVVNGLRLTRRGERVVAWAGTLVIAAVFVAVSYIESTGVTQ